MSIRSHGAVIRVYDYTGNLIETHEHAGEFVEPSDVARTPTRLLEIVGDDFPVLQLMSSVAPFRRTAWLNLYLFFGAGEATSFSKRGSSVV